MRSFILLIFIVLPFCKSSAQIDQEKMDSLTRSIENSRQEYRQWQDSFKKTQDSIYRSMVQKQDGERNLQNLKKFAAIQKKNEEKRRQQMYMRIGFGILMLGILVFGLARRKKKNPN